MLDSTLALLVQPGPGLAQRTLVWRHNRSPRRDHQHPESNQDCKPCYVRLLLDRHLHELCFDFHYAYCALFPMVESSDRNMDIHRCSSNRCGDHHCDSHGPHLQKRRHRSAGPEYRGVSRDGYVRLHVAFCVLYYSWIRYPSLSLLLRGKQERCSNWQEEGEQSRVSARGHGEEGSPYRENVQNTKVWEEEECC